MAMSSVLASAAGAVQQSVGAFYSSAGSKTALGLQADLDEINARLAEGAARDSLGRGEREYGNSRLKTAAFKGQQRAEMSDSGFEIGYGSNAAILTSTDVVGELDAETIKANAVREAWGHRLEASNLKSSARVNRSTAKSINPGLDAAATLLTSGGQVAGEYYKLKSAGAFGKPSSPAKSVPGKVTTFGGG